MKRQLPLVLTLLAASCGEPNDGQPPPGFATSLYALTETIDGVAFYAPLGPEPVAVTYPFDATLLSRVSVTLETIDAGGATNTIATFNSATNPRVIILSPAEVYFVNVPAATYFTDPSLTYRFNIVLDARVLGFSDVDSRVFQVLAAYPALLMGVKVRIEARPVPSISMLDPAELETGSSDQSVTITGENFVRDTVVRIGGSDVETSFISSTQLSAVVPASMLGEETSLELSAFTPEPGGGTSGTLSLEVAGAFRILDMTEIDFLTTDEGGLFSSYQIGDLALDWERDFGYFLRSNSDPTQAGIRRFRISTMVEDRQQTMAAVTPITANNFPGTLHSDGYGHLYVVAGSSNSRPIIRVSGDSLTEIGRFGFTSSGLSNSTTRFVAATWMAAVSNGSGGSDFLITGSIFDDIGILRTSDMAYVWGAGMTVDESRVRGVVAGAPGEGWILGSNTGTSHTGLGLYHVTIAPGAHYDPIGGTIGVSVVKVADFTPDQIRAGATTFWDTAGGLTYDPTDNSVIFQVAFGSGSNDNQTLKWRDGSIVWNVITPFRINYEGPFESQNRIVDGRWTLMRASRIIQLDSATGATVLDESGLPTSEGGAQAYDGVSHRLIVRASNGWTRFTFSE